MKVALTKKQYRQIKPYLDFLQNQTRKPHAMLVAQISDVYPMMRVGLIPGKHTVRFVAAASEKIPDSARTSKVKE